MADNFFGIEDQFSDTETANDSLFSDIPDNLKKVEEGEKKVEKKEEEKKEEKKIESKAPPKEEEKQEEIEDPNQSLFGDEQEGKKKEDEEDEKKKDVNPKKDDEEEEEEEDEDLSKTQFEILSNSLYELGVFVPEVDENDEEITRVAKTPQEFKSLFEHQSQMGMYRFLENYLSRFGDDRRELFDAIYEKGVDPKTYIPIYNRVQDFENLSLEEESNQERVVREFYKRAGIPEDKINKKVQTLKDTSYLQEESETFHPQLVKQDKESLKKQEDDEKDKRDRETATDVQYKNSIIKILTEKAKAKEFDGIPLTDKKAQQAYDFLYNKKWQRPDGKKFTDFDKFVLELNKPENHSLKVKVGLLALENFDLTKVQNRAISTETKELFSELATKKVKQATKKKVAPAAWNL